MILIEGDWAIIEFKNGPATNDAENCIRLAMEVLNLSKGFSSIIKNGRKPGKKMDKTGRIRIGIQKFVNKTNVTPKIVDELISSIRKGKIKKINAQIGGSDIELFPDNDVPGVIAKHLIKQSVG